MRKVIRPASPMIAVAILTLVGLPAQAAPPNAHAARVTIVRDNWGIAHVTGKTDADAVFGMIYAQAEDDFNRIETNYLVNLGRLSEAEGDKVIWQDLRQRLFIDPEVLKADYAASPVWLKKLMDAWADGLNYYLATHPNVRPRVLTHFEPWMALSFSEGSIGGDVESVPLTQLEAFYGKQKLAMTDDEKGLLYREPQGSNGFAIAPSHTRDGHALLMINPHTSFFFRSELQVTSGEGLNAYGAATWGQFFIYQGFNAKAGWMHTSSGVDNVDEFAEDDREDRRHAVLSLWCRTAPGDAEGHHAVLSRRGWQPGAAQLHHFCDPPRPDRARGRWQVDRHCADEQAGRGARAELPADQDERLCELHQGRRAQGQFVERHAVRRQQG